MIDWLKEKIMGDKVKLPQNYRNLIDRDAMDILKALNRGGYESYLVGGCVRDILLKKKPKDFDIATAAPPQQVKSLVRRCFIIGRRFRIAVAKRGFSIEPESGHLFPCVLDRPHEKEIQITTFRREPETLNGLTNENVFGSPREDAFRRDFTVNGLFLDIFQHKIVDYVGGMGDLKERRLVVIGDPEFRLKEDPIRILRAVRFAYRSGLKLSKATEKAIHHAKSHLKEAKKERVREEILKILREGHSESVFKDFRELGLWHSISESLDQYWKKHPKAWQSFLERCRLADEMPWKSPQETVPLLLIILWDLCRHPEKAALQLHVIYEDLKVFRQEREDIDHLVAAIEKFEKNASLDQVSKILVKNQKAYTYQLKFFYLVYLQSSSGAFSTIWKQWLPAWKEHLVTILSAPGVGSRPMGGGSARSRPFSRRRRSSRGSRPTTPKV